MNDSRAAARAVLLVTACVFINYIDRGNLATVAAKLQEDLGLTRTQLGLLGSAFFYSYVVCMPGMGWLAERFGAKRVLAGGLAIWAVATFLTGFAGSFATLLALRILLGIGESVTFPCVSKVLAQVVERGWLGVANGLMSFGYLLGPAVGVFVGGYLMILFGWRSVFIVTGSLSLLWLWPWRRVVIQQRASEPTETENQVSFSQILRQRALWGAALGHFASNYTYYFIISWLPYYLIKSRGFTPDVMVRIASSAYLLNALAALCMGWAADRWIRAGRSATLVHKGLMATGHLSAIVCMLGMVMLPAAGSVAALFAFCVLGAVSYPGVFAIPQIIAGPNAQGRWVGVQNACGNIAGVIAPAITGYLVDQTGLFDIAFALAAGVNVLGLIGWVFILPQVAPLRWPARQ
ncbi:MAG TPA: MFS transporter [Steroidobacteraceae bacterium]|nr:MFS transporter [Steroidobacteraceae bacterium]